MKFDDLNPLYASMAEELVPALREAAAMVLQAEITSENDDPAAIGEDFAVPGDYPQLRISLESTSKDVYQHQFIMDKPIAGLIFAWMVGDEPPEEINEEHFDAVKEVLNQMLGQITTAFDGEENAFTTGDITVDELASADDLGLPEDGTVVTHRFKRGEDEGEYTITHILQGEVTAVEESAEPEAPAAAESDEENDGISAEMAAELTGDFSGIDDAPGDGDFDDLLSGGDMVKAAPAQFSEFDDSAGPGSGDSQIDMLLDVDLDITVELGRKVMQVEEILRLGKGSVIELNKLAGEPVDILVNGKKLAEGEVVVIEDHFGVRITHLVNPKERIRSLGR